MVKKSIYTFLFLIITLAACEKELDINLAGSSAQIVINSKVFQDSTFNVNVYRTSLITENHTNLWYVDTATVKLYKNNTHIETLKLDSLGKYSSIYRMKPNTNYSMKVEVNGFETAATEITTLYKVPILKLDSIGTFIDAETEQIMYRFGIGFKDDGNAENYYMVDFSEHGVGNESTTIYSKDPAIEVGKEGYTYPDGTTAYWNFYLTDELFNGKEYVFTFCVPQHKVYEGFTVNLSHVTPEYFKYIQTYHAQSESEGMSMFYQAVQVYNNVENGLGIFGALSTFTKKYQYKYPDEEGEGIFGRAQ